MHRRLRDRSALITAILAPVALTAVLGFAFHGSKTVSESVTIGVAPDRGSPSAVDPLVASGVLAAELPSQVHVQTLATVAALHRAVRGGSLQGGVVVPSALPAHPSTKELAALLDVVLRPRSGRAGAGFTVLPSLTSSTGTQVAAALASSIASRYYAAALVTSSHPPEAAARALAAAVTPPIMAVLPAPVGRTVHPILDYFAPSVAVIFLFIGAGLGTRALLLERAGGTLSRLAAAPVRAWPIVAGKLAAIYAVSLAGILCVWGTTTAAFGASWGAPVGVVLLSLTATAAMCALSTFVISFARDEREALGIALVVGLALALVGGNLLPPGALPGVFQAASLATPNGWALVGFGRLALEGDGWGAVVGPAVVLSGIGVAFGMAAAVRVRRMVRP